MRILLLHALPLDERMWEPQLQALSDHEVETPNLYGLGGASMGGYCALAVARLAPERILGLVLAGSRADADSAERKEGRMAAIERIKREGAEGMWRQMEPVVAGEVVADPLRERLYAIALEQPPDGLIQAVRAIRDRPDSTDVVGGLEAPVRVVVGDRDPIAPVDYARELAATAPNGEAVVLEGVGHLPNLERPEEFNAALLDLVEGLE